MSDGVIFFFLCILLNCLNHFYKSTKLLFLKESKSASRVKEWEGRGLVNLKGVPRGTELSLKSSREDPCLHWFEEHKKTPVHRKLSSLWIINCGYIDLNSQIPFQPAGGWKTKIQRDGRCALAAYWTKKGNTQGQQVPGGWNPGIMKWKKAEMVERS